MKITYNDIVEKGPCYIPVDRGYCATTWSGSLEDILDANHVPAQDRIWAVLQFLSKRQCVSFAVWCANRVLRTQCLPIITGRSYGDIIKSANAATYASTYADCAATYAANAAATNADYAATYAANAAADCAATAAATNAENEKQINKLRTMIKDKQ